MRISELITRLQEIKEEHGDLVVLIDYDEILESDFDVICDIREIK